MANGASLWKWGRGNFIPPVTDPNGVTIHDTFANRLIDFYEALKHSPIFRHTVIEGELAASDLISYVEYSEDHQYWHLILYGNRIEDPFTGFSPGDSLGMLTIPDMDKFFQNLNRVVGQRIINF